MSKNLKRPHHPKSRLVREGEWERAIGLARITKHAQGPVLVVLDSDEDCPALLGPNLKSRAGAIASLHGVSIVIPKYEFETWFLAAAQSISGKEGYAMGSYLRRIRQPSAEPKNS